MKRGKVSDTILDRSVLKLLGRRGNTSKPAYGQDAAHIHSQGWDTLAAAATGSLAVYRAVNNISAAGGAADCIMNTIIIDEKSREIRLKEIIKELDRQCQVVGVGIAGGHTTVCPNVNSPVVSVTAIGHKLRTHQKAVAGQDIVMTKHIGMSGIRTVISHKRDEILNVLPEDVINKAFAADEELIIAKEAQIFIKQNIDGAMHDASEGGIFAALWDMAEAGKVGLDIDFKKIPVRQEIIEICEIFDVNPYELESCGALLMTADNGHDIIKILSDAGIKASVIGRTTADHNKILRNDDEVRYLDTPNRDEVYRFI